MIDQVTIEACAGNGGRGAVSFRREKFIPRGGPDGGRGGRGGHVIAVATEQANNLRRYRRARRFRGENGRPGGTNNRRGRDGADLVLEVPVGTVISCVEPDGGTERIADLTEPGAEVLLARAGAGGYGNVHFKSSTNRTPRVAQKGEPGEQRQIRFELRLIADVGLIGLPNAGKSTLLRAMTAARPRVAPYPFTTLEPHLGVVLHAWDEFVAADLPGLIEGAAEGYGLGHDFLRHVARTRVLVHVIDGGIEDPLGAMRLINHELAAYDASLGERRQIIAVNKIDDPTVTARRDALAAAFAAENMPPHFISAETGEGVDALITACARALDEERHEPRVEQPAPPVLRPQPDPRRYTVERDGRGVFHIHGRTVERFLRMMDLDNEDARMEAYRWLRRRGVVAALERRGIQSGDTVRAGESEWTWDV